MERSDFIKYIISQSDADKGILDSLAFELDKHIYYYGEQFKAPTEASFCLKRYLKTSCNDLLSEYGFMFPALSRTKITTTENNIISNAYFSFNNELTKAGYNVYEPFWRTARYVDLSAGAALGRECNAIRRTIERSDFTEILNEGFFEKIKGFKAGLKRFYLQHHIAALVVPYDMPFFENLSIGIFKELQKPSFIFLHGLPGRYNSIDENRSDYLIVWGQKIKEAYIKAGVPGHKIFVSGHPYYQQFERKELSFGFQDILVLTKGMGGGNRGDRGGLIHYLYAVKRALKKSGIDSVRLRLHPSENPQWYFKFIDKSFFKLDTQPLVDSLQRSSLVVGATSTVLLESIYYGVNYVIFEPCKVGVDLFNFELVPPFDGSDATIPAAGNEDELIKILKDKTTINTACFNDYIKTPFDISFIRELIK